MLKRKLVISSLLALSLGGSTTMATLAATVRGGGGFGGATPELLAPASASFYVGLDRSGQQGLALSQLVNTYRTYPGAGAALAQVRAAIGMQGLHQLNTLFAAAGNRVGLALWAAPPTAAATPGAAGKSVRAALIAQLKPASLSIAAHGGNPLQGLVTFSSPMPYHGTTVYRLTFNGGGSGYGAVISGDGVLATDLTTIEQVVDTATFRLPSLANDPTFQSTTAQLPTPRTVTIYVGKAYLQRSLRAAQALTGMAGMTPASSSLLRAYAAAVVAHPRGVSIVSSYLPATTAGSLMATPNQAASVVGDNAIFYASIDNLAGMLRSSGLLTPATLAQAQAQTGINLTRDVLPLFGGETAIDVNGETSPLLQLILRASNNGAAAPTIPVPGSLEIVTQVANQAAAHAAIQRILAAVVRKAQGGAGNAGGAPLVTQTTLPDGSTGYTVEGLPGLGYTFRSTPAGGTLLILSTSLNADVLAARTPLSSSVAYRVGLAHVAGPGQLAGVEYLNVRRLITLVNRILTATGSGNTATGSTGSMSTQQIEALFAPISTVTFAARQVAPNSTQVRGFISVQ